MRRMTKHMKLLGGHTGKLAPVQAKRLAQLTLIVIPLVLKLLSFPQSKSDKRQEWFLPMASKNNKNSTNDDGVALDSKLMFEAISGELRKIQQRLDDMD
ncbi:hypothetical protein PIB30_033483 [Stylosanthes scabra]|uniref:Uncharacterized protein n=1 Tax=Stylosanthes scabra TaxID=79078 RepID=A0ABU6XE58_9FABA|nr:hypothetical protein [Stylosanthes scabra]